MFKKVLINAILPIFASFLLGAIIISMIGAEPVAVMEVIGSVFIDQSSISEILVSTIPLICTGLSIAFAFRTGMFNIGAEGQFIIGGLASGFVAIMMQGANFYLVLLSSVLAGIFAGGFWAAIAGYLKSRFNISEVVVTIMLNYIALYFVQFFVPRYIRGTNDVISKTIEHTDGTGYLENSFIFSIFGNNRLGTDLILALLSLVIFYIVMEKTVFGYELRSVGYNKHASEFVGMKVNRNTVLSMFIAGGFAGLGGTLYNLGPVGQVVVGTTFQGYGYMGIAVALIGANTALGVLLGSLLFGFLAVLTPLLAFVGIPKDIANILIGLIVLFVAAKAMFESKVLSKIFKKNKKTKGEK
ncbi:MULTISPECIES: ABC transporter permease [unclassified Gemella]|uniref:ABC transporter permease n=1 Tax=unclassified Gemella TaxID=2624949 RepID=UPI001C05D3A2|nr:MULTISPECIES: ABC transporter permease [unclassified Gemella]MBU0278883.1 ABC transporter permease [Gemella sp. zg-1178]QWQ38579.1 ABC transporter permease [Gemella sp. zg-570]